MYLIPILTFVKNCPGPLNTAAFAYVENFADAESIVSVPEQWACS